MPDEQMRRKHLLSTQSCELRSSNHFPAHAEELNASAIFMRNITTRLPEFARSTTLRWTVLVAVIFVAFTVALLGFVYLKTRHDLASRYDRVISLQMGILAALPSDRRSEAINEGLKQDLSRVRLVGLFGVHGDRIAGNLERQPPELRSDEPPQNANFDRIDGIERTQQAARLMARTLPDGNVLVVGRNTDEIEEVARVVDGAIALGLIPA